MKKNIALIVGGFSQESTISVKSGVKIQEELDPEKYNVYKIIIEEKEWYYLDAQQNKIEVNKNDFSIELFDKKITFDCAFIIIHGNPGEDGRLQGYLDMLKIPYTTCDFYTSSITFNKGFCNAVVQSFDIVNVAPNVHLFHKTMLSYDQILEKVGLPCFVKPNAGGSSIGMSKVKTIEELPPAIEKAFATDSQVLIESFIKGRELSCGVMYAKNKTIVFPITEIIPIGKDYFDYEAKYNGFSNEITPANIGEEISNLVQSTASKLYELLNCKGIVRFDFIYNEDNQQLYFLEVNTIPGQSENSIVPQQIRTMGLTTAQIYDLLIESTLEA